MRALGIDHQVIATIHANTTRLTDQGRYRRVATDESARTHHQGAWVLQ